MSIPLKADVYAEMRFVPDTQSLASARRFVAKSLSGLPEAPLADLTLAIDEALANVIEHAGSPPDASIALKLYRENDHVRVIMTNPGVRFEGDRLAPVDLEAHAAARRTSGLGVFLMKQLMDLVLFRSTRDGLQELVMVKNLAA
ncbi:ATP-binding protein [bacterium]|nr:ATP-binding protein [bacterium]